MEIPIYIDGGEAGRLSVTRQGAATRLEARLRDAGRVVRLWVYGDGAAFYLGVPAPEEGELRLRRRVTPAEMKRFPPKPAYAAERPLAEREGPEDAPAHVLWLGGRAYYF